MAWRGKRSTSVYQESLAIRLGPAREDAAAADGQGRQEPLRVRLLGRRDRRRSSARRSSWRGGIAHPVLLGDEAQVRDGIARLGSIRRA